MNKEEILKQAQKEVKDEREEAINDKAFRMGWMAVTVIMLLLIAIRAYFNESAIDLIIVLMAQTAASSFYQYHKLPDRKIHLYSGIIAVIAIILGFAALLSSYGVY